MDVRGSMAGRAQIAGPGRPAALAPAPVPTSAGRRTQLGAPAGGSRPQRAARLAAAASAAPADRAERPARAPRGPPRPPITLTEDALKHLKRLREDSGGADMLLRVGVKAGGCSGMSYTMDFESQEHVEADDKVFDLDSFKLVTDPASLLMLRGLTLDYSNKLIGGGFLFQNPNAQSECGCGKSFGV